MPQRSLLGNTGAGRARAVLTGLVGGTAALLATPALAEGRSAEIDCARLTAVRSPDLRVISATVVQPKPEWSVPSGSSNLQGAVKVKTAICRVSATVEDEIAIEAWLPLAAAWNGRMLGVGNGGFAGFFRLDGLAYGVNRGFATVTTDTGHKQDEINWPMGHPRRIENYGHRGQHLAAQNMKVLISAFYGKPSGRNYFMGCSGGGMQAMNEAQRYPADYDGILAGAHGQSIVGLAGRFLASALLAEHNPAASLSVDEWRDVAKAAIDKCDALDGLRDGVISNPRACRFDISETPGLSPAKAAAAKALYGPELGRDGTVLFPGFDPGVAFKPTSRTSGPGVLFAQWGHDDPDWDPARFDTASDVPSIEARFPGVYFGNPDLTPFRRRGGKMISEQGGADPIVPLQSTTGYYDKLVRFLGQPAVDDFFRLYIAPGVEHCGGGVGADNYGAHFQPEPAADDSRHDMLLALMDWVEKGRPPGALIASKTEGGAVSFDRPLCAYPAFPRYRGGDPKRASSFVCAAK
jgi:feruloyl esterase